MADLAPRLLAAAVSTATALALGAVLLRQREPDPVDPGRIALRQVDASPTWLQRLRAADAADPPVAVRAFPDSTLMREHVSPDSPRARLFAPLRNRGKHNDFDEHALFRLPANLRVRAAWPEHERGGYWAVTNAQGLRMDRDVSRERPDLRVVLTGDSHMEGICSNAESAAGVLERLLAEQRPGERVEVLNAAVGGYGGYNEIGVLERHLEDGLDVFVQVVYGGNDFADTLPYRSFYERRSLPDPPGEYGSRLAEASRVHRFASAQALNQAAYFARSPQAEELALATACELYQETARIAASRGVRFVLVYLPSPAEVEWDAHADLLEPARSLLDLTPEEARRADALGDALLAFVGAAGGEAVDARDVLRGDGGPFYWRRDLHLNVAGHARVAAAVAARLAAGPEVGWISASSPR